MAGDRADPSSARTVLFVRQPFANHNGGDLLFGPDGDLYVGLGDGGSEGDPQGNGQSLSTLLGKMVRIRPTPNGPAPYEVPAGNPFVGASGARPEIWAFGLRNPWRFSFDRQTGDLWIGDVGQDQWEEIDRQPAGSSGGQNYGWNLTEGDHPYNGASPPPNWVRPVYEYSHDTGGCAVVGGYVYRGAAIPALRGAYLFSDNCDGRIMGLRIRGGRTAGVRPLGARVASRVLFARAWGGTLPVPLPLGLPPPPPPARGVASRPPPFASRAGVFRPGSTASATPSSPAPPSARSRSGPCSCGTGRSRCAGRTSTSRWSPRARDRSWRSRRPCR